MAPQTDRSHYYCGICNRRILKCKKLKMVGQLPNLNFYKEMYSRAVDVQKYACGKCEVSLKFGRYHRIYPTVPHQNEVPNNETQQHEPMDQENVIMEEMPAIIYPNSQYSLVDSQATTITSGFGNDWEHSQISTQNMIIQEMPAIIYPNSQTSLVDSQATTVTSGFGDDWENSEITLLSGNSSTPGPSTSSFNSSTMFSLPNPSVKVGIPSCTVTQKRCFICKKDERRRIPNSAIIDFWHKRGYLIPLDNRCCPSHLTENLIFKREIINSIAATKNYIELTGTQVKKLFTTFVSGNVQQKSSVNFEEGSHYTSDDYKQLTGLSREHFDDLYTYVKPHLRSSINRGKRDALGMFLMKLRNNMSQKTMAILCGVSYQSRISDTFDTVLKTLEKHFVPHYLGYKSLTREEAKTHQSKFVHRLLGVDENSLCSIADGTYLFIQKPKCHYLQKKTFSLHKKRNLVKPMIIMFPDGRVVECEGPYFADGQNNDATIMNALAKAETEFSNFFEKGDTFILDRGFRDSIDELKAKGYMSFMPNLLQKKQAQFTTAEGNGSRRVTMVRWMIEAKNGQLKKNKMLDDVIPASCIPKIGAICRVVCAMQNKYSPPLFQDTEENLKMAEKVLARLETENSLQKNIEEVWMCERKKSCWQLATKDTIMDFPKLSIENLKDITLGSFQLDQAVLYTRRHLKADSGYGIYVHKEMNGLIKGKIESRFTKGKLHNMWIQYDNSKSGEQAIMGYYCKCRVGARTVGCCSHLTSVMWYLSYARYNEKKLLENCRSLADSILNAADELDLQFIDDEIVSDSQENVL